MVEAAMFMEKSDLNDVSDRNHGERDIWLCYKFVNLMRNILCMVLCGQKGNKIQCLNENMRSI